ncbi:hypothetical protein ABES02_23070 [Neobacillus pocheonensis]|uniref:hypothetical protein n=1 Tax=Neobacillus pocheonensis TaxID=363869 RepID=UPI003D2E68B7
MKPQNKFSARQITKTVNSLAASKYLNLPDLQFFIWCNQQYGVNRGIYNTIDQWFFDYGIVNIYCRRIQLLGFLDYEKDELYESNKHKFIRFGHGGLTKRLNQFLNNDAQGGKVIPL